MKRTYDDLWKEAWQEATERGPSCRTRFRIMLRMFRKYGLKGSVLDVGCGDGNFLSILAGIGQKKEKKGKKDRDGFRLYGFDISNKAIELAKGKEFISDLFVGDLLDRKTLPKRRFDVVVCSEVLEHVDDYRKALDNIAGLVKKGGKTLITVPHSMRYWTEHDKYAMHFRRYEKKEFENDVKRAGFRIKEGFAWGCFMYDIYYFFLGRSKPEKVMGKPGMIKKILSYLLYYIFMLDDLFIGNNGRRLFILAEKI
ncbi:MAG: class I SAM-dependent methyltransferase [Candidatus Woesearchaeota archaeon]|nr:class I SAM-dependent methyltransferase [Candidatus Woesearchaeota archaeon]